ncbi:MAG: methyltransferase domain-containing protein [Saprospiraceae bacterium]|nr:methyltransferase domain-containing protein [Saprospiraceae bacterium]
MAEKELDQSFWDNRYIGRDTPWALNCATPALTEYMEDKKRDSSILIPGAGTSLEGIELMRMGFTHITFCDISPSAIAGAKSKVKEAYSGVDFGNIKFIEGDFFALEGSYDYIMEQTFFCALPIKMRNDYVEKMYRLLKKNGTLFGVLFRTEFEREGPPFGGHIDEYKSLFSNFFYIKEISICTNSVPPRAGNELFFICKKIVKE